MSRDPKKLRVFQISDDLVLQVYRLTSGFPAEERFGLRSQLRRAAVSVPANLVEGCTRPGAPAFRAFLDIALGSASETRYLLDLATRLGLVAPEQARSLIQGYEGLIRSLQALRTKDVAREAGRLSDRQRPDDQNIKTQPGRIALSDPPTI